MQTQTIVRIGLALLALFLTLRPSGAQGVRRGDLRSANAERRMFEQAAKKPGRTDFFTSP